MTGNQGWDELTPAERELADYGRSVLAAHFEASAFGAVAPCRRTTLFRPFRIEFPAPLAVLRDTVAE